MDYTTIYNLAYKFGFFVVIGISLLVIRSALISAKAMGGTLGQGIKKIAAGTIAQTILIVTYFILERGSRGVLTDDQISAFFIILGTTGSMFLALGYVQIYRIAKKLKLFTV